MKITAWIASSLLPLLSSLPAFAGTPDWEKLREEEGITTFRKEVPGSPVVAFRGEAVIEDSMARIAGVLEAVSREVEWMADVGESYTVEVKDEADRWEYNRTKTPWPLQDRDFVIHTRISFKREPVPELLIRMNSDENPKKPVQSGVVRGDLIDSSFTLQQLGPKRTRFLCEIHADPKGAIPKWVVNLFQKSWPYDTITGLKKQLKKPDIKENETVLKLLAEPAPAEVKKEAASG